MASSDQSVSFITNATAVTAKLGRAADKLEDPRGFLEQCRRILTAQEQEVWASEGASIGAAWKAAQRPELKTDSALLVASGKLKDSMSDVEAGRIRGATLRIKPKPYYGKFHQFGTVKMDARVFSGISDSSARMMMVAFGEETDRDLGI